MAHGVVALLLSSVAGYWVLERAENHKKGLRQVGRLLGWIIILVSLIGVTCRVWCTSSGYGGMGMKGGFCPFSSKMAPSTPQVPVK